MKFKKIISLISIMFILSCWITLPISAETRLSKYGTLQTWNFTVINTEDELRRFLQFSLEAFIAQLDHKAVDMEIFGDSLITWYVERAMSVQMSSKIDLGTILGVLSELLEKAVEAEKIPRKVFQEYFFSFNIEAPLRSVLIPQYRSLFSLVENRFEKIDFPERNTQEAVSDLVKLKLESGKVNYIGLWGKNGSGKTTFANQLREELERGGLRVRVVSLDNYFKSRKLRHKLGLHGWDKYAASLQSHIQNYYSKRAGRFRPPLTVKGEIEEDELLDLSQVDVVIFEGVLPFSDPIFRDLMDVGIYLDKDETESLEQLKRRDTVEKGREYSLQEIAWKYTTLSYYEHDPIRRLVDYADIVLKPIESGELEVWMGRPQALSSDTSDLAVTKDLKNLGNMSVNKSA